MSVIYTTTGPQVPEDGVVPVRSSISSEVVSTELHGKYYEQGRTGAVYTATLTVAANAIGTFASNVVPTQLLVNPVGSAVNAELIHVELVLSVMPVTPAAGAYGLAYMSMLGQSPTGWPSADASIFGRLGVNDSPQCIVYDSTSGAPTNAPVLYRLLVSRLTGTASTIPDLPAFDVDFDGTAVMAPGNSMGLVQVAADSGSNANYFLSLVWAEIPL